MVQCFRLATCKLSWPQHRAPVLGELVSGLKCQRRRDKSVSQPSIVLAAPTQLPRYRYTAFSPLYLMCWLSQSKPSLKPRFSKTEHL